MFGVNTCLGSGNVVGVKFMPRMKLCKWGESFVWGEDLCLE